MVMGDTLAPQGENGCPTYHALSLNVFQRTCMWGFSETMTWYNCKEGWSEAFFLLN